MTAENSKDWTAAEISRRRLLAVSGGLMLSFMIDGREQWMTPRQAQAGGMPVDPLNASEAATLTRLGNILAVSAGDAGLVHFVSGQLRKPHADSLLILRYFDVPPPHDGFYTAGLSALDAAAWARHNQPFTAIADADAEALVADMGAGKIENWEAPPAPFFYFVVRADAIDVAYGTPEGFARIGVPYMAHIDPETNW